MDGVKIILTSILSAAALFLLTKLAGHKQLSQLDFFDYVNGITVGSIAAELATELETPWKPLIALAVYAVISVLLAVITRKVPHSRKYINGTPCILMDNGKLFRDNMKESKIDLSDFLVMCREQGYFDLSDIQTAVLEYNGKLSVLPVSLRRPTTPEDLGLRPEKAGFFTEVIMDGRVLDGNLKSMGLDAKWLEKELMRQGFSSASEIFLGVCDKNHTLMLYPCSVRQKEKD